LVATRLAETRCFNYERLRSSASPSIGNTISILVHRLMSFRMAYTSREVKMLLPCSALCVLDEQNGAQARRDLASAVVSSRRKKEHGQSIQGRQEQTIRKLYSRRDLAGASEQKLPRTFRSIRVAKERLNIVWLLLSRLDSKTCQKLLLSQEVRPLLTPHPTSGENPCSKGPHCEYSKPLCSGVNMRTAL
jgi:hypothetical protein